MRLPTAAVNVTSELGEASAFISDNPRRSCLQVYMRKTFHRAFLLSFTFYDAHISHGNEVGDGICVFKR